MALKHLRGTAIAAACLAGFGIWLGHQPARAATFDLAIFHSDRDAFAEQFKWWAAEIEKRTQGRVVFKPHYSGSLVSMVETLSAVKNGIVPAAYTASSFAAPAIPALAYLEAIGGMPDDPDTALKALAALQPTISELFRQYGVVYLWSQLGFDTLVLCRDKHMKAPADWKGAKVRAAGRWQSAQVAAMGASPTAIDPGELYLALQNKTVDCGLSIANLALSLKLYEVAPKITELRQPVNLSMYIMNPRSWNQIAPADQAIVREVSHQASQRAFPFMRSIVSKALDEMKQKGADLYALNDEELKVTRQQMRSIFDRIAAASGDSGKAVAAAMKPYW
jgi:TRAP-type C4-dicarboxylate transport system substrate-binding protein